MGCKMSTNAPSVLRCLRRWDTTSWDASSQESCGSRCYRQLAWRRSCRSMTMRSENGGCASAASRLSRSPDFRFHIPAVRLEPIERKEQRDIWESSSHRRHGTTASSRAGGRRLGSGGVHVARRAIGSLVTTIRANVITINISSR